MDLKGWLPLGPILRALPWGLRGALGAVLTLLITSLPLGSTAWAACASDASRARSARGAHVARPQRNSATNR